MEYKTTVDDAFKVATCVIAMAKCDCKEELEAVGRRIAISDFSPNDLVVLRHLYREKAGDFEKSP